MGYYAKDGKGEVRNSSQTCFCFSLFVANLFGEKISASNTFESTEFGALEFPVSPSYLLPNSLFKRPRFDIGVLGFSEFLIVVFIRTC